MSRQETIPSPHGPDLQADSRAVKAAELAFHPSAETTLGVELELQIVDRETRDLVPGAPRILKACADERVSGVGAELMQSMIEVRTDVCAGPGQVQEQMVGRLSQVLRIARSFGFELALAGTHPFHRAGTSALSPSDRYDRIVDRLAWLTGTFARGRISVPSNSASATLRPAWR